MTIHESTAPLDTIMHSPDPTTMSHQLDPSDTFVHRHIGPDAAEIEAMLATIECDSLDDLANKTVPPSIRLQRELKLGPPRGERELIEELRETAKKNRVVRNFIGIGYYGCSTPPVIQRNILENPGWYTQYTPYQAEISQGRLEALINFQTMVADLTGLPLANASLLDEATAAAEAMTMCYAIKRSMDGVFVVSPGCHPQTIAVVKSRAKSQGIELVVAEPREFDYSSAKVAGVLVQYPDTEGSVIDPSDVVAKAHEAGAQVVVATDLLALTLLKPPGEFGADIVVGSSQRFGVPLGFGGPHAAFMSTATNAASPL